MRTLRNAALLLLVLLPATASAGWVPFASGAFAVGSPVAASTADACVGRSWGTDGVQDGLDSNCFEVPRDHRGRKYQLFVQAEGAYLGHNLCWFTADYGFSQCVDATSGTIPAWAAHASISAYGGTNVRWTMYALG